MYLPSSLFSLVISASRREASLILGRLRPCTEHGHSIFHLRRCLKRIDKVRNAVLSQMSQRSGGLQILMMKPLRRVSLILLEVLHLLNLFQVVVLLHLLHLLLELLCLLMQRCSLVRLHLQILPQVVDNHILSGEIITHDGHLIL